MFSTIKNELLKKSVLVFMLAIIVFNLKENLRVSGEGMPHFGGRSRGDLIIELIVKTPKKLSAKAKKILEDFEKEFYK